MISMVVVAIVHQEDMEIQVQEAATLIHKVHRIMKEVRAEVRAKDGETKVLMDLREDVEDSRAVNHVTDRAVAATRRTRIITAADATVIMRLSGTRVMIT